MERKQGGVRPLRGLRVVTKLLFFSKKNNSWYWEPIVCFKCAHIPKGIKVVVELGRDSDNYELEEFQ